MHTHPYAKRPTNALDNPRPFMDDTGRLLSAMLYWTLTRTEVARDSGVAHAVLVLSYLSGGLALALSFAGMTGAASVITLRTGGLPRWVGWLGLATAGLALLSVTWLIWDPAFNLLLLAAFLGFLWLFATSIALVRNDAPWKSYARSATREDGDA
jgi:hypothetical protein